MIVGLLAYVALVLTVATAAGLVDRSRRDRLSAPLVHVGGDEVSEFDPLLNDPTDVGVRVTRITVASPTPLTVRSSRYTVQLAGEESPRVSGGSHADAKQALLDAGFDDARLFLTLFAPGVSLVPGHSREVFGLIRPYVRRLARLDAEITFADALGRTVTKTVPALPKQRPHRPVTAEERLGG